MIRKCFFASSGTFGEVDKRTFFPDALFVLVSSGFFTLGFGLFFDLHNREPAGLSSLLSLQNLGILTTRVYVYTPRCSAANCAFSPLRKNGINVSKHAGSKSRLNRKRGLACTKKFRRKNPLRRRSGAAGGSYTCRVYV